MSKVRHCTVVAMCLVAWVASGAGASPQGHKVILDTDPGTDDAMAILLALNSPELEVKAITVVAGNMVVDQGVENARKLVSLAGRCGIPVVGGASHPLVQALITAEYFHGANGLGNIELPAPRCPPDAGFAPDVMIKLIHEYPHEITLIPLGPLTNVALALRKDPSIVSLVKEVVLMGGSIAGGNASAAAEANIYNDPEAARSVFEAGWPITMVGLNVTEQTLFTRADLRRLAATRGQQNDFAAGVMRFLLDLATGLGSNVAPMHDPLAVGAVIDPTLISTENMWVEVETRGEFTRGETVASRHNASDRRIFRGGRYVIVGIERVQPNVHVAVGVESRRFIDLFISRLAGK